MFGIRNMRHKILVCPASRIMIHEQLPVNDGLIKIPQVHELVNQSAYPPRSHLVKKKNA